MLTCTVRSQVFPAMKVLGSKDKTSMKLAGKTAPGDVGHSEHLSFYPLEMRRGKAFWSEKTKYCVTWFWTSWSFHLLSYLLLSGRGPRRGYQCKSENDGACSAQKVPKR